MGIIFLVIIIMNLSQEATVFSRCWKIDYRYETDARMMSDFKFDALRVPREVELSAKLTGF